MFRVCMKLKDLIEDCVGMATTADIAVSPTPLFTKPIKRSPKKRKTKKD